MTWDSGLAKAVKATGGIGRFARKLEITTQAVYGWKRVPAERVIKIEGISGVDRETLRPDLYHRKAYNHRQQG
jgi:DNA-binding transcriptional regulator YdaS (Cro superfamily)